MVAPCRVDAWAHRAGTKEATRKGSPPRRPSNLLPGCLLREAVVDGETQDASSDSIGALD